MRTFFLASTIAVLGLTSTAEAHFILMAPAPANPKDATGGKGPPPCGPDATPATAPVAVQGGHTLHLDVKETTFHPGWYRIALAMNSRSEFPADPKVYDAKMNVLDPAKAGVSSASADMQTPAVFPVLAADVWDHKAPATTDFTLELAIPNMDCPKCTLQIEEFMNAHPSNVGIGGYFYHHCADIKITADPAMPLFVPPGADGGAPDAIAPMDAKMDGTGTGTAGAAGTAGAGGGGTTGAGGATGAGGSTSAGTAGTAGGTTGTAGSTAGVTGTAGSSAGTAGSTGASGSTGGRSSGGGGCTLSGSAAGRGGVLGSAVLLGLVALARRRRRR
jgi:hypothetical protein